MTNIVFILYFLYYLFTGTDTITTRGNRSTYSQINQFTVCEFPIIPYPKPAKYPGGIVAWRNYLSKNINYPQGAIDHKVEGIVRVQFTIGKNGLISNVSAFNDPGQGLAAEVERIIKSAPKWKPALQDGKPVSYLIVQTITFRLQ